MWRSFGYAATGLGFILRSQPNFGVHLLAAGSALALALALRLPAFELAILALAIGLVLALEAMNSALEVLADVVSPAHHPGVKNAKDAAAAGVLLAAAAALAVGVVLFVPRLLDLFLTD